MRIVIDLLPLKQRRGRNVMLIDIEWMVVHRTRYHDRLEIGRII